MDIVRNYITWETQSGESIVHGDTIIVPQSQALRVRLPNGWGGLVWNRPTAVLVTQEGMTWRLPIVDLTRLAAFIVFGVTVALSLSLVMLMRLFRK